MLFLYKRQFMAVLAIVGSLLLAACQSSVTSQNTRSGYTKQSVMALQMRERWKARVAAWHERRELRISGFRAIREERIKRRLTTMAARKALNEKLRERRQERYMARRERLLERRMASLAPAVDEPSTSRTLKSSNWRARLDERKARMKAMREKRIEQRLAYFEKNSKKKSVNPRAQYALAARIDRETRVPKSVRHKKIEKKVIQQTKVLKKKRPLSKPKVKSKGGYDGLIAKYANQHGVPYKLARAVVQVESTFRPDVTGAAGEIGLMQIKLATARGMGFKGSRKELYDPATNLYWGMKYLGKAHQLSGGSTCGTILKYNAGHGARKMNRISARYCGRVKQILT